MVPGRLCTALRTGYNGFRQIHLVKSDGTSACAGEPICPSPSACAFGCWNTFSLCHRHNYRGKWRLEKSIDICHPWLQSSKKQTLVRSTSVLLTRRQIFFSFGYFLLLAVASIIMACSQPTLPCFLQDLILEAADTPHSRQACRFYQQNHKAVANPRRLRASRRYPHRVNLRM